MLLDFAQRRAFRIQKWIETTFLLDSAWIVKTYWKRIVFFILLGLMGGYGYNRWKPAVYESRATVRFIPPQVSETYVQTNIAMQVEQRIFAVTQMLRSRLTATQMIDRFGLYPQRRRFYPIADIVPYLQDDLRITTLATAGGQDKSSVPSIEIAFRYSDPEKAQKVVQRIVELIYEENRRYRSDQSIGTTDFLQQEVKGATEQLNELEEQLAALPRPGGESQGYEDLIKVENLHDLERRLTDLEHQMNYITLDRNLKRATVTGLETLLNTKLTEGERRLPAWNWTVDRLRSNEEEAERTVEDLQRRYRPGNEERALAERRLAKIRSQLDEEFKNQQQVELSRGLEDIQTQLTRARAELAGYDSTLQRQAADESRLRQEVAGLRAEFAPKENLENERLNLLRRYQVAKDEYGNLMKRQRESEMASNMERRGQGETAEMVEPPTLPSRPEVPTATMIYGAGGGAGALLGYLLGVLSFLWKPRVRLAGHIGILGDIPVLASLPSGFLPRRPIRRAFDPIAGPLAILIVALTVTTACSQSAEGLRDQALKNGNESLAKHDYAAATLYFRKAIQADAKSGLGYAGLSEAYLGTGQLVLAHAQLIRAGELLPNRVDVQEKLAETSYELYFADPGRPAALLREVEQLAIRLKDDWPKRPTGYRLLAQVLVERRHSREAIDLMETLLERMEDGSIRTQLASVYYQNGDKANAEKHLRQCVTASPKFSPGYDLLYLQMMEQGRTADAREVLASKLMAIDNLDTGLQLAAHDEATGAKASAEQFLAHLAKRWGGDPETYARIGDFWLHRSQWEKARYWYESGRELHPPQRSLYTGRLADVFMGRKDRAGAKALIDAELQRSPKDGLMIAYQAALEMDSAQGDGERRQTQAKLENLVSRMPNSPFVRLHLGRAYLLNGDALKAAEQIQNAVTLDPNYAPGWLALAEAELALGNVGQAQEHLNAVLRRSPGYAPARLLKAQASLQSQKPTDAEGALTDLIKIEPDNTEALLLLARAKMALGHPAEAANLLGKAAALAPNDLRLVMEQARLELGTGKAKEALARLKQAHGVKTPEFEAMFASVALYAGEHGLAAEGFKKLTDSNPSNLEYRLGYASSLGMLGKKDEAAAQFQQVQKKSGNDARAWLLYGALMASTSNAAAERNAYEEALKRDPENPFALNNLALLLARTGQDLQKALTLVERAHRTLPKSWEVNDTLAYVYLRLGLTRNAVATLEEVSQDQRGEALDKTRGVIDQLRRGELAEVRRQMEQNTGDRN